MRISPPEASRWPASTSTNWRWPLPETPAMPTISPALMVSDTSCSAGSPASSSAPSRSISSRGAPNEPERAGDLVSSCAPIIMPGHRVGREIGDAALAGEAAAPQDGDVVGERHHLAEFMGDHQDGQVVPPHHIPKHAEDLVGLPRREHRGRLVEDEEATLEVEL